MSAVLNVQVVTETVHSEENFIFFKNEHWTNETEVHLIQKVYELVEMVRPYGKKLNINLLIEATDADFVVTLIKQKLKKIEDITTQKLSSREIEIIGLLMQGFSSQEIADKLFICYETVKSHRKHILEKTGARNTAALISYYHQTFFEK